MYELQKINRHVFTNVSNLMENIGNVTRYAAQRVRHPMEALRLVPTVDGKDWFEDEDGNCWRMYHHIENSICFQRPASTTDFYESAKAFGSFQEMMAGFPAEKLHETIPDFHNTPVRYRQFHKALEEDKLWIGMAAGSGALLFSAAFLGTKLVYLGTLLYLAAACLWFALRLLLTRRAVAGQCLAAALALCALLCALYPVSPLNHYVQDVYVPMSGEDRSGKAPAR